MNFKLKRVVIALALFALPILSGCGGSDSGSNAYNPYAPGATCGTINGIYSCSSYTGATSQVGCVPVTQPIGFRLDNMTIDSTGNFVAGVIPNAGAYGSAYLIAPTSTGGATYTSSGVSGAIQMSLAGGYGSYPYNSGYPYQNGGVSSAIGVLQLSQVMQSQIYQDFGSGYYGSTYGGQVPCVSGIAIRGYMYQSVGGLRADVYLYINNTGHGKVVSWY